MSISQQINAYMDETPEEKQARENRLRAAEIMRRLKGIDEKRVRPLAAIETGKATDYDRNKLTALESEAEALRAELASLETEVQ